MITGEGFWVLGPIFTNMYPSSCFKETTVAWNCRELSRVWGGFVCFLRSTISPEKPCLRLFLTSSPSLFVLIKHNLARGHRQTWTPNPKPKHLPMSPPCHFAQENTRKRPQAPSIQQILSSQGNSLPSSLSLPCFITSSPQTLEATTPRPVSCWLMSKWPSLMCMRFTNRPCAHHKPWCLASLATFAAQQAAVRRNSEEGREVTVTIKVPVRKLRHQKKATTFLGMFRVAFCMLLETHFSHLQTCHPNGSFG